MERASNFWTNRFCEKRLWRKLGPSDLTGQHKYQKKVSLLVGYVFCQWLHRDLCFLPPPIPSLLSSLPFPPSPFLSPFLPSPPLHPSSLCHPSPLKNPSPSDFTQKSSFLPHSNPPAAPLKNPRVTSLKNPQWHH